MAPIQWYPGHMTRTNRQLAESIKQVDIVVEILDARIPASSRNPELDKLLSTRQRLIALNKSDLADTQVSSAWKRWYQQNSIDAVFTDSKTGAGLEAIKAALKRIGTEKVKKHAEKGVVRRPVRAMIVGIPNSGKSTLINKLAGKATAKTGDRPGVTRAKQWIRLEGGIDLLDTPGILWPKFEDEIVARNLAFTGAIKDEIMDTIELSEQLLTTLLDLYPQFLEKRYGLTAVAASHATEPVSERDGVALVTRVGFDIPELEAESEESKFPLLSQVGKRRGFLIHGGKIDLMRAATMVLDEFRSSKIGRVSLERPAERLADSPEKS